MYRYRTGGRAPVCTVQVLYCTCSTCTLFQIAFRNILKKHGVTLSDEESVQLCAKYEHKASGRVDYSKFISHILKNQSMTVSMMRSGSKAELAMSLSLRSTRKRPMSASARPSSSTSSVFSQHSRKPASSRPASAGGSRPQSQGIERLGRSLSQSQVSRDASLRDRLDSVRLMLRQQLRSSWKALLKEFKKNDRSRNGEIPARLFRRLLAQFDMPLSENAFYAILSTCTGGNQSQMTISYNTFLRVCLK